MIYHFKPRPELIRSVGMAVGAYMLEAFADPRLATDPRGWTMAAGIGCGHAVVVAILGLYSAPQGQQAQAPTQPASAPLGAVQPPLATPGPQGGVWVTPPWHEQNYGAADVRVGQSRPVQPPAPPAPPVTPPIMSAADILHQRRVEAARRGAVTRAANRAKRTPPDAAPPG